MSDCLWSMSLMIKHLTSLLALLITVGCQVTESTEDIPLDEQKSYVGDAKNYQYLCDGEGKPLDGFNYVCVGKTYTIFNIGNGWALLNEPDLIPRTTATGFMLENQEGGIERSFDKISGADVMTVYGESGKQYDCVFTRNRE